MSLLEANQKIANLLKQRESLLEEAQKIADEHQIDLILPVELIEDDWENSDYWEESSCAGYDEEIE